MPWLTYHGFFLYIFKEVYTHKFNLHGEMQNGGYIMKLSRYILKHWYAYLIAVLCIIISVALNMLSPQITKTIIDDVITGGDIALLPKLLLFIFLIGVGRAVFQYLKEFIFDMVSSKIANTIRKDLFQHIQKLSMKFFHSNNTGELMSRVKDDVDTLWSAVGFVGMLLIEILIHTGIVLYCMYNLSPSMSIIPTIALPLMAGLALLMERKLGSVYEKISEQNAKLNTVAQENLSGVRTVKSFAREKFEINKFLKYNKEYYELNMKQSKIFTQIYPYFQFVTKLLPLLTIVIGGYQVINGTITLGTLAAFVEYSMNIVWPMEMLGWLSNSFASAVASNKRIKKVFAEEATIKDSEIPTILEEVSGDITFDHVSFSIDDKEILSDISFHLVSGKTLGIMGITGTGKSSIINLLQRFYDVDSGEIKLDDTNIKDLSLNQLRKSISLVMQDVFLFSDTINENIKMGDKASLDFEKIKTAAHDAQASSFIERMDNQYETIIGERGVGLSGGQKQRISIARALAKKTPILVLDDSTSALDMETEHLIQKTLTQLESTKIIIAHRISAVRNADEIIILENGKIVERGTHTTLLNEKGYYHKTFMAQYGDLIEAFQGEAEAEEVSIWQ